MAEKTSPFLHVNAVPPTKGKRLVRAISMVIGVLLLAVLVAAFVWHFFHRGVLLEAVVDGRQALVQAPASGQILDVQTVAERVINEGEPLFVLDISPSANGQDAAAQTKLKNLEGHLNAAEKAEEDARTALRQASQEHARTLVALRSLGQPDNDAAARQRHTQARAEEAAARSRLENARTFLETASSARYVASSAYRQMRADLGLSRDQARHRPQPPVVIPAPMSGMVTAVAVERGSSVSGGQTLAVIQPVLAEQLWISAYARPADAARFTPGQIFRLRFPDVAGFELDARLESVDEAASNSSMPGVPVRLSLPGYDPLTMTRLSIGQRVEAKAR